MEEDLNSIFDENQETNDETNTCLNRNRVILHFDIDCFYAQVEMIKDPSLASKPLGIQQKNIVVTCNYIAREKGVGKCTWIPDAMKACPELVLVNGEDLADYRRWSQQIFDLIYRNTLGSRIEVPVRLFFFAFFPQPVCLISVYMFISLKKI